MGALDDTRNLAALLGFLAAEPRDFTAAAAELAALRNRGAAELVLGILRALGDDVAGADWKVSVAGYVFAQEDFLLRTRGVVMNIAPVLAEFGPEETDDLVMRLTAPLTESIARQTPGVRFVSICPANSDQYLWGAVAAQNADAVDGLLRTLGLDGPVGLTVHRLKRAPQRPTPDEPRPVHRRKRAPGAPRTPLPTGAPAAARYWSQAVANASEPLEIRCGYSARRSVERRFCALLARYSRGDEIAALAEEARVLVGHDLPALVARFPPSLAENDSDDGFDAPGHAWMARFAALLVLARATVAEAQAFADVYARWNAPSLVVDAFLGHLGATRRSPRRPANAVPWPGLYAPLWRCLTPTEPTANKTANMLYFLAFWHRKLRSAGIAPAPGTVTNHSFVGHWSLEAAAAVVVAGMDDSAFRDHPHFPRDFADAAR